MKRELTAEPDLEALAGWDDEGKGPCISMPPLISATELYRGHVSTLRPLFDGLLWNGLTMLIARPKAGKSWFTLQLAVHVAGGRRVEGITALEHGRVLYAALEEPKARTIARLKNLAPDGDWAENLNFVYELLPLLGGGAEQLAALIQQLQPRMVVLDTFTALVKAGSKAGSDVFRSQYGEVSRLRKLAEEFGTSTSRAGS